MERHLKRLTELICVWTPDGVLTSCNDACCDFLGAAREELIGREWIDLLPGPLRPGPMSFPDDFLAKPRPYRREQAVRHATGEQRWIDWINQPIYDAAGNLREVLSEGRDITERKRAEEAQRESERRYRLLFDEAIEGMVLADGETGVVVDCNNAFLRLTGHERSEVVGQPVPMRDQEGSPATLPERLAAACRGTDRVLPAQLLVKGRSVRHVTIKGGEVHIDGRRLVHAFFHDVTQERLAERYRDATLVLLRLLNEQDHTRELLRQLIDLLQGWTQCEAIGVRLREGEDYPYYETRGFATDFVRTERTLCRYDAAGRIELDASGNPVLDCLCGRVLRGDVDPSLPCFTPRGSFWTNSVSSLDAAARVTRARCASEGYESMALVPLRHGDEVLGLLQLSDRTRGRFGEALIAFLENAADQIAIALAQKAKLLSLEGGLRQIARLLAEIGVGPRDARTPLPPALRAGLASLSRRETEVLRLLLRNRRPATIARELSRSVHTVRNQLKAIFRKLNVHSQEELLGRLGSNPELVASRATVPPRRTRGRG